MFLSVVRPKSLNSDGGGMFGDSDKDGRKDGGSKRKEPKTRILFGEERKNQATGRRWNDGN